MHELDSDVLRVRCGRPRAEGEQASAALETVGHVTTDTRERFRFAREERRRRLVARAHQ
jgi:hypothetical protein